MAYRRPFRFGAVFFDAPSREVWAAQARKVEDLGFTTLSVPDHVENQLAPLTALMAAADATSTLRIGSFVCANDYRNPAMLAKEVATLDFLSGGRFEFGIGAGYLEPDYRQTGIPFDQPGVRVSRLVEAVQILKGSFGDSPVTFSGMHYTIANLEGYPKPIQKPHPPILIGASGKRMLTLAAREADIVSLVYDSSGSQHHLEDSALAATARRVAWVQREAGARFERLEFNAILWDVMVTNDRQQGAEQLAPKWNLSSAQILDSIHFLVGSREQIIEELQTRRERFGISYLSAMEWVIDDFAPIVARLAGT